MTQQALDGQVEDTSRKRSRGPGKPFPPITFEEALSLPKSILENGFDGEIQRLTLLRELDITPASLKARNWISGSYRYGLTEGSYTASSISVTEAGRVFSSAEFSSRSVKARGFELAIGQFEPFKRLYEKLKDNRLRQGQVLHDELKRTGILEADCPQAAEIFTQNLRFLDLVETVAGSEYVRKIDTVSDEVPANSVQNTIEVPQEEDSPETEGQAEGNGKVTLATNRPALHVDIQVHIDPTSSSEQIDQIFASMAKHLYGNES